MSKANGSDNSGSQSSEQKVKPAAHLYTLINELQVGVQDAIHYHLGFQYATEALSDKLADVGVDASWRLLDVCCGWGVPTRFLADRFKRHITGVDITQRSIDLARQTTEGTEAASLITFQQGSALNLPSAPGEIDLVWSQDGFCHVPDRPRLLQECFRVLRSGGYLVFSDWMRGEYITAAEFERFCTAWSFQELETPDSYRSHLTGAGFEVLSQEEVGREYAAAGEAEFLKLGATSFIQRTAAKDTETAAATVGKYGLDVHLAQLERENMDIYVAQGKMALGRFVCRKPDSR
jgi:ubiquinone/menaquinone biosynthesis C-methylase UbiE